MNFATLIKNKRVASGMTLQEVGDAAGITKGHLHTLENDKHRNPGLFTCARLALALGLNIQAMAAAVIESNMARSEP